MKQFDNIITFTGAILSVIGGWLAAEAEAVFPALIILLILMILDYASRLTACWKSGTLNSEKGARGIAKKIGYLLIICCAMCFDFIVSYYATRVGIAVQNQLLFGMIVCVWYCLNETLSIIENVGEFSTVPEWLAKRIENIRDSMNEKGNDEND